jgi:CRISPR/Cas system endoribonuclease Cas6 (RAMP superfamily)
MSISIQNYTFHCRFETEARLPGYLGSTLRGSLGWALKKTACALRRQQCTDCLLREQCGYAWIFETERYDTARGGTVNARPHPFVLQPLSVGRELMAPGDPLEFDLRLFGSGNDYLPQLVYAVRLMGETGIGTGRRHGLGRFVLDRVSCQDLVVYSAGEEVLQRPAVQSLDLAAQAGDTEVRSVTVTLATPLRLKRKNSLQRELPFAELIRACLRRISALEDAYGPGEPELNYPGLIRRAAAVRLADNGIRWRNLYRWSNRQKKKVSLSGLAGTSDYRGNLAEFLPLLKYAEQVNIGKQTVFGLGRLTVRPTAAVAVS